jgi:hypothetical protein
MNERARSKLLKPGKNTWLEKQKQIFPNFLNDRSTCYFCYGEDTVESTLNIKHTVRCGMEQ